MTADMLSGSEKQPQQNDKGKDMIPVTKETMAKGETWGPICCCGGWYPCGGWEGGGE
jgi:hypothetical protein